MVSKKTIIDELSAVNDEQIYKKKLDATKKDFYNFFSSVA